MTDNRTNEEQAEVERDAALARIAELEQSLRSESLARMVDTTLLHEYQRRFAEAAKLHRPNAVTKHFCIECDRPFPCYTRIALGLNEGENND